MKTHNLKLRMDFCDDVLRGKKTFEIRYNDRGYQTGDLIKFIPINGIAYEDFFGNIIQDAQHPISEKVYRITYILSGWGLKDGYVALGIEED